MEWTESTLQSIDHKVDAKKIVFYHKNGRMQAFTVDRMQKIFSKWRARGLYLDGSQLRVFMFGRFVVQGSFARFVCNIVQGMLSR